MTGGEEAPPGRPRYRPLPDWVHPATRLIHGARQDDLNAGSVVPPIYQASTFHYPPEFSEVAERSRVQFYTRLGNPSQEVAAELIRQLEGAEAARVFGSGMGAISTALLTLVRPGNEVVALEDLYGGTLDLLAGLLPSMGVRVRWVGASELKSPESVVTPATKLVVVESPTNPLLRLCDLGRWAAAAHGHGALLLVDNTFATPVNQSPIRLGADLVAHSASKYFGGHADLIAGALVGSRELLARIDATHQVIGSVLDPFAAFLLTRGLRTLEVRVVRQNATGATVAGALGDHPKVSRVFYPGRSDPDDEALARQQMRGRGGMVSLALRGGAESAHRFLHHLRLVHVAGSLGGVESLASMPAETSHRHLLPDERERRGIEPGLVRLSLGLEHPDDLVRDLSEALDAA